MKKLKMTAEEAERLAKRDRNRLILLGGATVMVAGLYLYSMGTAERKAAENEQSMTDAIGEAPADHVEVLPFEHEDVLAQIDDSDQAGREFLEPEPLARVFEYARIQTPGSFEAMGIAESTAARIDAIVESPSTHRLEAMRVRGRILDATARPRENGFSKDWTGSLETADGRVVHFLVAGAPMQGTGERGIERGDYLRIDGLFHALYERPVDLGNGPERAIGPYVVGPRAEPSTPTITEEIARLMPSLGDVRDDTIGAVFEEEVFQVARWELLGHAKYVSDETDWESVPELTPEALQEIHKDGEAFRGRPFRIPVSVNADAYWRRAEDNPLRIERYTEGWIGNNRWKDPVPLIRWIAPFERPDLMREDYGDDNRYVVAQGYFFRNHVYETSTGKPGRAPVFVLSSIELFEPEPSVSLMWIMYGVFGLTIALVVLIFALLRADKRKSAKMYEDLVARKRARRERAAASGTA